MALYHCVGIQPSVVGLFLPLPRHADGIAQHIRCFEVFGGAPQQVFYDRMETAFIDEDPPGQVVNYNFSLLSLLHHYGSMPRACRTQRMKTKGKVERMYRTNFERFSRPLVVQHSLEKIFQYEYNLYILV